MNYIGSKRRLAARIVPHIQEAIKTTGFSLYLEPFVGGANVIDKVDAPYRIGADNQRYLVALLSAAGGGGVEHIPETITREEYEAVRENKERYPEWYVGLVGFCASYKSKFFGGYANGVHTKTGAIRNYTDESIRSLKRQREALSGIPFICCDYRDWLNVKNAVIYCDPPYRETTQYSSGLFDSDAFFDWCRAVAQNNVLIVSEYDTPEDFTSIDAFGIRATLGAGQPDFKGTLTGGRAVVFEAKHTDSDRIEQSRLTDEQVASLTEHHRLGAAAFVLVSVGLQDFFRVPWEVWRDMKDIYGHKHMKLAELEPYRVQYIAGVLKLLEGVELDAPDKEQKGDQTNE